jgi:hypothetical protein
VRIPAHRVLPVHPKSGAPGLTPAAVTDGTPSDEQDDKPLALTGVEVKSLPFYKLSTQFGDLDQSFLRTGFCPCTRNQARQA